MECDKCFEVTLFLNNFLLIKSNTKAVSNDKMNYILLCT
jgi:hypothetical protein